MEMQQEMEELQSSIAQTKLTAQKSAGKSKRQAEKLIENLQEDVEIQKQLIENTKDILFNMHAEFESECKKKIEQLTNAVKDPSSWDASLPPAAVQANAQPEPLASKWDPISSSGGAEPITSKIDTAHSV